MFRTWVKQCQRTLGISTAQLASELGVTTETVYQTNNPTLSTIQKYVNIFGIPFVVDGGKL